MKQIFLVSSAALWITALSWAEEDVCVRAAKLFPKDVRSFVENRCYCDHFREEPDYDQERREYLNQMMEKYCTGTDRQLQDLKKKYAYDNSINAKLNEYEEKIEAKKP